MTTGPRLECAYQPCIRVITRPAFVLMAVACMLTCLGCQTQRRLFETPVDEPAEMDHAATGVIHVVSAGQTLWRIARAYGLPLETLAAANSIEDPTKIRVGQKLVIPGAMRVLDVPPARGQLSSPDVREVAPLSEAGQELSRTGWLWPLEGQIVSRFGARRPHGRHLGIDISAPRGTPVRAARAGEVAFAGVQRGFGKLVVISHRGGYSSWYAHARSLVVKVGQHVRCGELIAHSGASGNASGPHLHFEIRRKGRALDPLTLLP